MMAFIVGKAKWRSLELPLPRKNHYILAWIAEIHATFKELHDERVVIPTKSKLSSSI